MNEVLDRMVGKGVALVGHALDQLSDDRFARLDEVDQAEQKVFVGLGIPDALFAGLCHLNDDEGYECI